MARNQSLGTARPIHELSYQWSFDDASARFEALPDDFPDSFKDANAAQGPLAGHVFEQPGTYEVRVWVANRNQDYATDTITITVEDPDTAYAGDRTICHSNSGNFSGCPSGAQRFTSAVSALGAANQDRMRVLFRSGEDTLLNADTTFRGLRDIQVGPFGSGQKPILRVNSTVDKTLFTPRETDGFTIFGLDMRGDYDPRTGLGENFDENGIGNLGNIRNTTVFRNRFSGLGMAMVFIERPVGVIVADNEITDWYDYGTYNASANQTAYVGNSIKQNPNAVSGTGGTNRGSIPRWADHGPNRTAEVISLVVAQNDIFSNTGWSSSGQAHQPTIRYNQSGSRGHFGVINRNRLEGGATVVSISTESNSVGADVGNLIFERNLLIGTDNTAEFFALTFGGTTIRNNIAIMPDVVNTFNSFWTFAGYQARPTTDANAREPVVIAGNAIIQLQSRSPQEFQILRGFQNWANANYRTTNNLVYAPNIPNSSAFTNYTPLDQNEKYRPLAGSSAIGAATPDDLVFDTLDGRIRPAAPSVGALEP
ncbi:PKD domain-containing protein [Qipengyuania aquimaris]|uniref:PKD domain-containing protein n=1 Tax=Qipengyuania aquimaris TaxID=255984 RepID=A0A9Q3S1H2_9SPHN|nr:PKD domain-containing protein [Qipengyuania aquimaris]MBY6218085.1 PKD domain-containing protein [Qipengyuania aquimaris]